MARKVGHGHYIAAGPAERAESSDRHLQYGYSTDGEESRAPSDPTLSEYMIANERAAVLPPERKHRNEMSSEWSHHMSEKSNGRAQQSRNSNHHHQPHHAHHPHHHHKPRSQRITSPSRAGSNAPGSAIGVNGGHGGNSVAPAPGAARHGHDAYDGSSDIYVTSAAYRAPSELSRASRPASHYSYRSGPARSEASTVRTTNTRKGGVVVETMAAPNPFCPNTKGICCLMLLVNLGLILVTLGFVIVIQFFEPVFVWILGIVFLVFGFLTLAGSLIYCVHVCRDAKTPSQVANEPHYWTHHWQKDFTTPEIRYKSEDKFNPNDDRFSDRYSDRGRHHHDRY